MITVNCRKMTNWCVLKNMPSVSTIPCSILTNISDHTCVNCKSRIPRIKEIAQLFYHCTHTFILWNGSFNQKTKKDL